MAHDRVFLGNQLQPRQGISAGLLAGAGMLALWALLAQIVGSGANQLLGTIAATLLGAAAFARGWWPAGIAITLHLFVSIILGLLFAASLDRLQRRETLMVATFYGFTIWVVAGFIVGHWFNENILPFLRTWWGLLSCLSFGFILGLYASARGAPPPTISPD